MKEVIKKILKEEIIKEASITTVSENSFFNGVLNLMDNPPYLPLLYNMELSEEDIVKVFELMYRNLGEERLKVSFDEDGSISVIDPVFHNRLYYEEPHLRFEDTTYWEKWDYWPGTNEWKRYVDMNGDRRFRSKNGIQSYGKDIEPEDMVDGFYPPLSTGNLTEETTQSNSNSGEWYYQYVYDSKYLNGVLEQLLNETKMEWDTDTGNVIVQVDWNPSNPSILYQSSYGTFKKHCQEVYSLKNEEVSDMYTLYIMEIKEIIREKEEGGSKLTL